jgi:hypothetical protein
MLDFNRFFDKTYVINLDRRADRYNQFLSELKKHDISGVDRYSAIDGSNYVSDYGLLSGELGILMTHHAIIKECIDKNVDNVLLLEDDVYFTDEIANVEDYMSKVPSDWDFIYFGGNHKYGTPPELINDRVIRLNYTVALQCVAINKTMFEIIDSILSKKRKQVDAYYAELHDRFNAYGFYPSMAKQMVGFSDIQNRNVDYNNYFND